MSLKIKIINKIKNYILQIIIISTILSCNESDISVSENSLTDELYKSTIQADNYIVVQTNGYRNNFEPKTGSVQFDFKNSFKKFSIEGRSFEKNQFTGNIFDVSPNLNQSYQPIFDLGRTKSIAIDDQTKDIYYPKNVHLNEDLISNTGYVEISRSNGINLSWQPDQNDPDDEIYLVIIQTSGNSEDLESTDISHIVSNDNSYRVTPDELSNFILNDDVDIFLARGNETKIGKTAFTFFSVNTVPAKIIE